MLPLPGLFFPVSRIFYMHRHRQDSTNYSLCYSMIGNVRSRIGFILSSQSWEIGSPPTGGAGRMKLFCVVPVSAIHI